MRFAVGYGVLLGVITKKFRTRRTKAKKPAIGREDEPLEAHSSTRTTLAAPAAPRRWWTDIIDEDDDDGELPNLSDWGV